MTSTPSAFTPILPIWLYWMFEGWQVELHVTLVNGMICPSASLFLSSSSCTCPRKAPSPNPNLTTLSNSLLSIQYLKFSIAGERFARTPSLHTLLLLSIPRSSVHAGENRLWQLITISSSWNIEISVKSYPVGSHFNHLFRPLFLN
jgi:hypothetical protein